MSRKRLVVVPLPEFYDRLVNELGHGLMIGFFIKDGELVHVAQIGQFGYEPLSADERNEDGPAQIRLVTLPFLRARLQERFEVGAYGIVTDKNGNNSRKWKRLLVPKDPISMAIPAAPLWDPGPPRIDTVTHTPIVRPDGSLITQRGYDSVSQTLYLPDGGLGIFDAVDEEVDAHTAWEAVAQIDYLLSGFPFETAASKANYIAMLFTPLLRLVIPPPYPLMVLTAHQPGSGKTLLAKVAKIIHGAVMRAELPSDSVELRKQITTVLARTTAPIVVWDNLEGVVKSPVFAGLLTSVEWSDRELGFSRDIKARNDRVWLVTGNNLLLGGDMARRCYFTTLDPKNEHPETRTDFAIRDLLGYTTRNRRHLLAALLTIIASWVDQGMQQRQVRSDDYDQWAGSMAEILHVFEDTITRLPDGDESRPWSSLGDAFAAQSTSVASVASVDDEELGDFLRALQDTGCFTSAFTAGDVVAVLRSKSDLVEALPEELGKKYHGGGSLSRSLGRYFARNKQRYANGLRVEQMGEARGGHAIKWRIAGKIDS